MSPTARFALVMVLTSAAACSFDGSALDERPPCDTDADCPRGICVDGSCWNGELADAGTGDAPDGADADEPDTLCTPAATRCLGNVAGVCGDDGATWVDVDCSDSANCPTGDCVCVDGACATGGCTPETRRCQGDTVVVCNPLGGGWDEVDACDATETCLGGECVVRSCTPGETFCAGELLVRCSIAGAPMVVAECNASDAWCSDDAPEPHCEPWVCSPASLRCSDDATAVEQCASRGNGWTVVETCDPGSVCDEDECVELDCTPGSVRCAGPTSYATCDETGQAETITRCDDGTYCAPAGEGAISCESQLCPPSQRRCATEGEIVEVCDERGTGFTITITCNEDEFCREGICTAQTCEPGATRCVGPFAYLTCDERGALEVMTTCEAGNRCDATGGPATCVPQSCTPGDRLCASATLVDICDVSGAGFGDHEICTEGNACEDGFCVPTVCTPRAFECTSGVAFRECNDVGTRWVAGACDGDQYCSSDDGECAPRVCDPGALQCDGDDLVRCDELGASTAPVETCTFGCADGACNPSVCGDGIVSAVDGEQCDDGNTDPCDGCDACRFARIALLSGASTTSATATWQPDESDVTIEAWVNVTSASGALFGLGARNASDFVWVGVSGGKLRFEFGLADGVIVGATSTATLNGTGWHHVAVERFDIYGAAIFVDGKLDTFAHAPRSARSLNQPLRLWVASDGTTIAATSRVDALRFSNVRRYAQAFTPSRRYATDGATVALYQFDGTDAAVAVDSSGNARHMTVASITRTADGCYGAAANALACGDGAEASWEECDDGNVIGGDGCSATCLDELCPAGEARGPGNHCYFVSSTARQWDNARDACSARGSGSNLVTVDNELENDWMVFFLDLGGAHWNGLSDGSWGDEGVYRWVRGDSGYRNWASGEPNDGGTWSTEDCVGMYGTSSGDGAGQWNDFECNVSLPSVCERY